MRLTRFSADKALRGFLLISILLQICLFAAPVQAAEPKASDGGAAIKKAQGMIRQLSQEKTALEAEKTQWRNEKLQLEIKVTQLENAVKALSPLQAEVERYKTGLENVKTTLETQLGQERQNRHALLQKHNDTVTKANAIYADNQLLVAAVKEREQWIKQCSENNHELRNVNLDIIKQYRDKNLLQQALELEPFTGIASVETDSIAENYRFRLQQLQITPFQASQPTAANEAPVTEAPATETNPEASANTPTEAGQQQTENKP